ALQGMAPRIGPIGLVEKESRDSHPAAISSTQARRKERGHQQHSLESGYMNFVALGHYSRTGKDTFANYLGQHLKRLCPSFSYAKVPLAWKLKQIAHDLYAWDGMREPEFYDTVEGQPFRDVPLPTIGKTP